MKITVNYVIKKRVNMLERQTRRGFHAIITAYEEEKSKHVNNILHGICNEI